MTTPLNLRLCQEDPPYFRKELTACEESIFGLESTIRNLVRLAKASVELATGLYSLSFCRLAYGLNKLTKLLVFIVEYTSKQLQFADEFRNFAKQQPDSSLSEIIRLLCKRLLTICLMPNIFDFHFSRISAD